MQTKQSFRDVNVLLLLVLCLQVSNYLFLWMPQFVRMILNEALFIFLPAYLYLRLSRQPIRERIGWHWPGWKAAALAFLIGMGLYPLSAVSAGIFQNLLGYTHFELPADAIPTTLFMGVLAIIAYAVMAPLCEEFLFRGVIQPVYEQLGGKWAVFFVGFLFIAFHLSLLQGLSIILLSLALGLVYYRTRSLQASILTHFGANLLAALVLTDGVFKTGAPQFLFTIPVILGGGLLALAGMFVLLKLTRQPASLPTAGKSPRVTQSFKLSTNWPLLVASLFYLFVIGSEFFEARPSKEITDPLHVNQVVWNDAQTWRYEIRNIIDTVVGEGECNFVPEGDVVELRCQSVSVAYEVQKDNSLWMSSGGERTDWINWQLIDGSLLSGGTILHLRDGEYTSETLWTANEDGLDILMHVEGEGDQAFSLPWDELPNSKESDLPIMVDFVMPWQLAGIPLQQGESGQVVRFNPYTWREKSNDHGPLVEPVRVNVDSKEEIHTPSGVVAAWKVQVGERQTIWFTTEGNPMPIKFFNGIDTWSIK